MPVTGVYKVFKNTDGTIKTCQSLNIGNLLRSKVIGTGSNHIQDVVLDEAVQGIHTVCEILEAMAGCIYILRIDLVIDRAGQVIEGTQITLLDAVLHSLRRI